MKRKGKKQVGRERKENEVKGRVLKEEELGKGMKW